MSNTEKRNAIRELTATAGKDTEISDAIKEIAKKLGLDEEVVLKAFVSAEVEKELEEKYKENKVKKTIKE